MANLVIFHEFGYPFLRAEKIYVLRKKDIQKTLVHELLQKMYEVQTTSVDVFFTETKICILTDPKIYSTLLLALRQAAKNL